MAYAVIAWRDYDRILAEATDRTVQRTAVLHQHALKVFEAQDLVLRLIDERISDMSWDEIAKSEDLYRFLRQLNPQFPQVDSVWLIGADGKALATSRSFPAHGISAEHRDYFQALREHDGIYISGAYTGPSTGTQMFIVARRRTTSDGRFDGVIAAAVPLKYLLGFYVTVTPGYDRVINLTRADGAILVRDPVNPAAVTVPPDSAAGLALQSGLREGVFETKAVVDGVQRIYAFRRIGDYPVFVIHGIGKHAVLAQWRENMVGYGIAALAAALMFSMITLLAYRRAQSEAIHRAALRKANESLEERVKQRTEALAASEQRFRHLADAVPAFVWITSDADGRSVFINERWYAYTGLTAKQSLGHGWATAVHPDDRERCMAEWENARRKRTLYQTDMRIQNCDGDYRWFIARAEPVLDHDGTVSVWFGTSTDIHDRREAEDRQLLLVNELNHRVKNTLAAVQSIAQQTRRSTPSIAEFARAFDERLMALSRAHDILTREAWTGALINDVAHASLDPFDVVPMERFTIGGPSVRLLPATAVSLSMALHELATNAVKYGALSVPDGHVMVRWSLGRAEARDVLTLKWEEQNGPAISPPSRQGFGMRLIERGLAHQLNGRAEIIFAPDGVRAEIEIPLSEAANESAATAPASVAVPVS
jgi:PAS domain S-box-containing protein